jgi:tetratricopeptide (TPR) repeat protein
MMHGALMVMSVAWRQQEGGVVIMGRPTKVLLFLGLLAGAGWLGYRWFVQLPPAKAASLAMGMQDYDRAIPLLERAFEQSPQEMDLVLDLAECYDRKGNTEMSRKMYRFAQEYLSSKPNNGKYAYHHERALILQIVPR